MKKILFSLCFIFAMSCSQHESLVGQWEESETDSISTHKVVHTFYEDNTWMLKGWLTVHGQNPTSDTLRYEYSGNWSEKDDLIIMDYKSMSVNGSNFPSEGGKRVSFKITSRTNDKIEYYEIHDAQKTLKTLTRIE